MTLHELEQHTPAWFYDVADQLRQHVYRRSEEAFAAGDAARDAVQDRAALEARQQAVRARFVESLGGLPPLDTPLEPRIAGVVRGDGFRVEKVVYQSRPGHHVTANLYVPDGVEPPTAAVLFLCGHHAAAKHQPEYQSVCLRLAQAGLVVLAQDPVGQGERWSYWEPATGTCTVAPCCPEHDYAGAQCLPLGDSLARYELHDAMRSVDYLSSRPEVDPTRIGVTGNSGGGTQTCLMMLADPRIAAAAPGTFIMNRQTYLWAGGPQDAEQIWPGFTAAGCDHEDVLLCMAPRPVCVLAVSEDFFPVEGTRRTVERCRRIWEMCGREDALDLVEDRSSHAYTPALADAAARFFSRHLLGHEAALPSERIAPFEPSLLWCMSSGQVRGEVPGAVAVFEANEARLAAARKATAALGPKARDAAAREWLRERVMGRRRRCDLNPRFYATAQLDDLDIEYGLWWSQSDLLGHGALVRDHRRAGEALPVTVAIWEGGTHCLQPHVEWLRTVCQAGRAALVLDVAGSGALAPRPIVPGPVDEFYGTLHKLATDLIWLDDDLAALRTYDVLRAMDVVAEWRNVDAAGLRVHAYGREGLYGLLAAWLDPRVTDAEVVDGMEGWAQWVGARHYDARNVHALILRGALQRFDLCDAMAALKTRSGAP